MANVEIIELTALTNPASSDVLPIVDVGADETKKVTIADLLENAGSGNASAAAFAFDGDADTGMYRTGANALGFTTGGTGRLFIDSSGNVGIGAASPSQILHVYDDNPQVQVQHDVGSAGSAGFRSRASGANSSANASYYEMNGGSMWGQTGGLGIRFGPTDRSVVDILINTNSHRVGIGTQSPAVKCDVVGQVRASNGILFGSDTAAANALDDYEEGAWTPVHSDAANTTATLTGLYRKIGNVVYIRISAAGSGTLKVGSVSGLPFTNIATIVGTGGKVVQATAATSDTSVIGYNANPAAINLNLSADVSVIANVSSWVASMTAVVF